MFCGKKENVEEEFKEEIIIPLFKVLKIYKSLDEEEKAKISNIKPSFCNYSFMYFERTKQGVFLPSAEDIAEREIREIYNFTNVRNKMYMKFVGENIKNGALILSLEKSKIYDASECPICLQNIDITGTNVTITECGHVFHTDCIVSHLRTRNTCPNCNTEFQNISKVNSYFANNPVSSISAGIFLGFIGILCFPIICGCVTYQMCKKQNNRRPIFTVSTETQTIDRNSDSQTEIQTQTESQTESPINTESQTEYPINTESQTESQTDILIEL